MSSPSSSRQPGSTSPGASSGHGSRSEDSPLSPAMPRPNAWQSAQAVIGIGLAAAILYWGVPWFGETTWPEIGRHLQLLGLASSLELFALVAFGLWLYTFALTGSIPGLEHLLERLDARLARLDLDEVEQLVLAIEHEVVQPREELDAFADVALCPFLLRCARPFVGGDDVVGRRRGQRADRLPRQRRHAFLRRAARDDAGAHASDGRLVESERTLRAGLGVQ